MDLRLFLVHCVFGSCGHVEFVTVTVLKESFMVVSIICGINQARIVCFVCFVSKDKVS